jgi:Mg2+ and Co2+ transporter CorA
MAEAERELLRQEATYAGEGISVRSLEESIRTERSRQDVRLTELAGMKLRNAEIQQALAREMSRLKELSDELGQGRRQVGGLRRVLRRLFGGKGRQLEHRSIEELLRAQYELSSVRVKEAAELVDRLDAARQELYDEVDRLNRRIVESATNEETAAATVEKLRRLETELELRLRALDPSSASGRQMQADLDLARRRLAEHTTKLRLFCTAEERLGGLKQNTWKLAEVIGHLQLDVTRYVGAASEKLDLIAGQIQAIGAAADASLVMLELKQSLDAMTESVQQTTRFVAETQAYFRDNVDRMVDELHVYDSETQRVLTETAAMSEAWGEAAVEQALSDAIARRAARAGIAPGADSPSGAPVEGAGGAAPPSAGGPSPAGSSARAAGK